MHRARVLCLFLLVFGFANSFAQTAKVKLSGTVLSDDFHPLENASIYLSGFSIGTQTDSSGNFLLLLSKGEQHISVSYVGFEPFHFNLNLQRDTAVQVILKNRPDSFWVEIIDLRPTPPLNQDETGIITLKAENIQMLPSTFGEHDLVKAVQMLPGVQSGNEGVSGIFVRGGSPDENIVLLDGATVYNPSHLYGFISVFNSDAVSSVSLHKSDYPAQFGGRLGSVMDVQTAEGDTGAYKGSFTVGLLTSRAHFEGPLKKPNTTLSISARGCYVGAYLGPLSAMQFKKAGYQGNVSYFFYDLNVRLVHHFKPGTSVALMFFMNDDRYKLTTGSAFHSTNEDEVSTSTKTLGWKNYAASADFKQRVGSRVDFEQLIAFSRYELDNGNNYRYTYDQQHYHYEQLSKWLHHSYVNELTIKPEFVFRLTSHHVLRGGLSYHFRQFQTGRIDGEYYRSNFDSSTYVQAAELINTHHINAYLQYDLNPVKWFALQTGVRLSSYMVKGLNWLYPQYRINVQLMPIDAFGFRAATSTADQPIHMLTNSTNDIALDYWVPATALLKPQTGWQASAGIMGKIRRAFSWSIDGFYKSMHGLTDLKQGSTFEKAGNAWENEVLTNGDGRAYGMEIFFAKTGYKLNVQLAYTLQWSERKFAELNDGKYFPYGFDRRHDLAIAASYHFNDHWDASIDWVYGTGNRYTLPVQFYSSYGTLDYNNYLYSVNGFYPTGGESVTAYNPKNSYTLPAFHHLDVGCNYRKRHGKLEHVLNISIYNVYSRQNVFSVYTDYRLDDAGNFKLHIKQLSLFPILPSVSYTLNLRG